MQRSALKQASWHRVAEAVRCFLGLSMASLPDAGARPQPSAIDSEAAPCVAL